MNINWDIALFSAPVAYAIFLFFTSFPFIIVHATNSIKFKLKLLGRQVRPFVNTIRGFWFRIFTFVGFCFRFTSRKVFVCLRDGLCFFVSRARCLCLYLYTWALRSGTTRFKCSCLWASLLTVLCVIFTTVWLFLLGSTQEYTIDKAWNITDLPCPVGRSRKKIVLLAFQQQNAILQ